MGRIYEFLLRYNFTKDVIKKMTKKKDNKKKTQSNGICIMMNKNNFNSNITTNSNICKT